MKQSNLSFRIQFCLYLLLTACQQSNPPAASPMPTLTPSPKPTAILRALPATALTPTLEAAETPPVATIASATTQPPYCDQLAETYQPAEGYLTYCDADYLFAFDYPEGWTYEIYTGAPNDPSTSPVLIRRGQVFKAAGYSNYIGVDTYRMYEYMSLPERVQPYWSYADRESANKAYPTFTLGGRQAYALINRYVQAYSVVSVFFQHGEHYTVIQLTAIDRSGLDTNWAIARSLQVSGVTRRRTSSRRT